MLQRAGLQNVEPVADGHGINVKSAAKTMDAIAAVTQTVWDCQASGQHAPPGRQAIADGERATNRLPKPAIPALKQGRYNTKPRRPPSPLYLHDLTSTPDVAAIAPPLAAHTFPYGTHTARTVRNRTYRTIPSSI